LPQVPISGTIFAKISFDMESERNVNELQAFRASNKTNPEDMID
jgi:hypothetical protein